MNNIVERVANGEATWQWHEIVLTPTAIAPPSVSGFKLRVKVMKDAMKINGVRFCVTAVQQQQIADLIGGIFHTERTQDARHSQANTVIHAVTQVPPGSRRITAISNEVDYSKFVDLEIKKATDKDPGLVSTVGKPWTLTNNMTSSIQTHGQENAYNYGWHDSTAVYTSSSGMKVWQPIIGPASKFVHNNQHKDPSQVCEMPSRDAVLEHPDGTLENVDLAYIYAHPVYHFLATQHKDPMRVVRQPLVVELSGQLVLPHDVIIA